MIFKFTPKNGKIIWHDPEEVNNYEYPIILNTFTMFVHYENIKKSHHLHCL